MKSKVTEYDSKHVQIPDIECIRETTKAILVVIDNKEHWIPQSNISDDSDVYRRGDKGKLIITKWIATQRGLWESEED